MRHKQALETAQEYKEIMDFSVLVVELDHSPHNTHTHTNIHCDNFILWQTYFLSNTLLKPYQTDSPWFAAFHSTENFSWLVQWCDLYRVFILIYGEYLINYTHLRTHFVFTLPGEGHLIHLRQREYS